MFYFQYLHNTVFEFTFFIRKEAQKYAVDEKSHTHSSPADTTKGQSSEHTPNPAAQNNADISSGGNTNKDPTAVKISASEPATRPRPNEPKSHPQESRTRPNEPRSNPQESRPRPNEPRTRLYSASQVHFGKILNQASSFGEYRRCPDYVSCQLAPLFLQFQPSPPPSPLNSNPLPLQFPSPSILALGLNLYQAFT